MCKTLLLEMKKWHLQGTTVIVVECTCSDDKLWKTRLEKRASLHSREFKRHKPSGWKDIQALLQRYQLDQSQ